MGVDHIPILFYCISRWLSKGNVLVKVFEITQELYSYLNGESHKLSQQVY